MVFFWFPGASGAVGPEKSKDEDADETDKDMSARQRNERIRTFGGQGSRTGVATAHVWRCRVSGKSRGVWGVAMVQIRTPGFSG